MKKVLFIGVLAISCVWCAISLFQDSTTASQSLQDPIKITTTYHQASDQDADLYVDALRALDRSTFSESRLRFLLLMK